MAKKASIILKLKDEFSGPLKVAERGTKKFEKQTKLAKKGVKHFANQLNNHFKKAVKTSAIALGTLSAAAAKVGFSEAMDLEGYKTQLVTATKDTKRAAEVMEYAIKLANATPFEGGELVSAAAALESFGLKSERWLPVLGDAAAGVNKSMEDVQQGFIKAATLGDFQSLRDTLSVTKEQVEEFAKTNFGKSFLDAKGAVKDTKLLQDALEGLLQERFGGGMEGLSKTWKGLWSTVTGVAKNSLANIVGMSNDGTVKAGSAYELLKNKIQVVADTLQKWQSDGTIDRISEKVGKGFTTAFNLASKAIKFLKDNMNWLKPVMITIIAGFAAFNIISGVVSAVQTLRAGINVLRVAFMGLNTATLGWTLAIGAVIVIVILLIKNWKKVVSWLGKLKERFLTCGGPIGVFRDNIFKVVGVFKTLVSWVGKTIDKVKSFLGLDTKKTIEVETTDNGITAPTSRGRGRRRPPEHATGTTYFKGGLTGFSERGRSEEAIFPSGTRIIPADKAGKGGEKRGNIIVNLIVQGNVIGNKRYMEETGNYIAKRIIAALGNI